jgi:hypothetical protein
MRSALSAISNNVTIAPSYLSTIGAWNGTGFALGTTTANDVDGQIELYFQHHTGSIRFLSGNSNGTWTGGDPSTIVATDAKDATPLSIVTYTPPATGQATVSQGTILHLSDAYSGTCFILTTKTYSANALGRHHQRSGPKVHSSASTLVP